MTDRPSNRPSDPSDSKAAASVEAPAANTPAARPYVLLSVAMSIDAHIDDATDERLLLSNEADLDRVDSVRAGCDAIMIGAETVRRDNPGLLVNSESRRAARVEHGLPGYPLKATITASGNLDPDARFFTTGGEKVVYSSSPVTGLDTRDDVTVVRTVDLGAVLDDLGARGVRRLMVEGGTSLHTRFLAAGLADEIQLAVAPFFVGDPDAPTFVGMGVFPQDARHRMTLAETYAVGDMVFARYLIKA